MIPFRDRDPTLDDIATAVRAAVGTADVRVDLDPNPLPPLAPGGPPPARGAALNGVCIVLDLRDGDPTPWQLFDRVHADLAAAIRRVLPHTWTWRLLFAADDGPPVALARSGHSRTVGSLVRPSVRNNSQEKAMEAESNFRPLADDVLALVRRLNEQVLGITSPNEKWELYREKLLDALARMPYAPREVLGDDLLRIALKLSGRDGLADPSIRPEDRKPT